MKQRRLDGICVQASSEKSSSRLRQCHAPLGPPGLAFVMKGYVSEIGKEDDSANTPEDQKVKGVSGQVLVHHRNQGRLNEFPMPPH
jgi:hypothetical protein